MIPEQVLNPENRIYKNFQRARFEKAQEEELTSGHYSETSEKSKLLIEEILPFKIVQPLILLALMEVQEVSSMTLKPRNLPHVSHALVVIPTRIVSFQEGIPQQVSLRL